MLYENHVNFLIQCLLNTYCVHSSICIHRRPGLPGGSDGKKSACNVGDLGSIPESGRSPGEGNSYPLLYSFLENSMDRGAWRATVHGVAKSQTQLSDFTFTFTSDLRRELLSGNADTIQERKGKREE